VGAIPEMLDNGKCGILIKPRSADEICIAVERLMSDKDMMSSLVTNAKERVNREYSISSVWDRLVNVWKG
jgi:glycosyltransferase involved in cell wall biosynthesis